jgi:phosphatidylglycerophosphatase A
MHRLIPAKLAVTIASGFGIGFVPWAPGTFGSVLGIGIVGVLKMSGLNPWVYAGIAMAMFLIGVPICRRAAEIYGVKDPGWIVWDEITALPFAFVVCPFNVTTAILGFLLFRLFDISKPPPIKFLERLPHGWGIMTDDVIAGFYTGIILALLLKFGWLSAM